MHIKSIFNTFFFGLLVSCSFLRAHTLSVLFPTPFSYGKRGPTVQREQSRIALHTFLNQQLGLINKKIKSNKHFRVRCFNRLNIGLCLVNCGPTIDTEKTKKAITSAISHFEKKYQRKPYFRFKLSSCTEFFRIKAETLDIIKKIAVCGNKKRQFNDFILLIKNELQKWGLHYKILLKPINTIQTVVPCEQTKYAHFLYRFFENIDTSNCKLFCSTDHHNKTKQIQHISLHDIIAWQYTDLSKIKLFTMYDRLSDYCNFFESEKTIFVPEYSFKEELLYIPMEQVDQRIASIYISESKDSSKLDKNDPYVFMNQLTPYVTIAKIYGDKKLLDCVVQEPTIKDVLQTVSNPSKSWRDDLKTKQYWAMHLDICHFKSEKIVERKITQKDISEQEFKALKKALNIKIGYTFLPKKKRRYSQRMLYFEGDKTEGDVKEYADTDLDFVCKLYKKDKIKIRYLKNMHRFIFK